MPVNKISTPAGARMDSKHPNESSPRTPGSASQQTSSEKRPGSSVRAALEDAALKLSSAGFTLEELTRQHQLDSPHFSASKSNSPSRQTTPKMTPAKAGSAGRRTPGSTPRSGKGAPGSTQKEEASLFPRSFAVTRSRTVLREGHMQGGLAAWMKLQKTLEAGEGAEAAADGGLSGADPSESTAGYDTDVEAFSLPPPPQKSMWQKTLGFLFLVGLMAGLMVFPTLMLAVLHPVSGTYDAADAAEGAMMLHPALFPSSRATFSVPQWPALVAASHKLGAVFRRGLHQLRAQEVRDSVVETPPAVDGLEGVKQTLMVAAATVVGIGMAIGVVGLALKGIGAAPLMELMGKGEDGEGEDVAEEAEEEIVADELVPATVAQES